MKGRIIARRSGASALDVDQRAHAPELIEPVKHLLRQERRQRFDDRARRLEVARRALDLGAHDRPRQPAATGFQQTALCADPASSAGRAAQSRSLRRQAHVIARVGPGERRHHQRARRRRCASSARRRGRYRADRSARAPRSASARRARTSRPAAAPSRRCRCPDAAAHSPPPPPRPRRPTNRRDCALRSHGLRVSG